MKQFIYPYIMFKNTQEAVDYYIEVFGGEVTYVMKGSDTPDCPKDKLDSIMHLQYKLNGSQFYMADSEIEDFGRIHLHLDFEDLGEMKKAYENLKVDSDVLQELNETFWGAVFATVKDKFNVTWQLHYTIPEK